MRPFGPSVLFDKGWGELLFGGLLRKRGRNEILFSAVLLARSVGRFFLQGAHDELDLLFQRDCERYAKRRVSTTTRRHPCRFEPSRPS